MSFASAIKIIKKDFLVKEEKKDKEGTLISKNIEVSFAKGSIDFINEFMEKIIKNFNIDKIKDNENILNYIQTKNELYKKNLENAELKNTNQKSGLIVNTSNVNKFISLPEDKKKIDKEALLITSAFAEYILKLLIEESAHTTIQEFKKHITYINHIKLAIFNNPLLLKIYNN